MKSLIDQINHYKVTTTSANKEHTHTYFGDKIYKLSVPEKNRDDFYSSYVNYINSKSFDELGKGPNCITEKSKENNRFFVDIDIDMKAFESELITVDNVEKIISDAINTLNEVIEDAIGKEISYPVTAFRMIYKCHVFYPDLVFTPEQGKTICKDAQIRLGLIYPWMKGEHSKIVHYDYSVYTSGLRMLYSHKGAMGKGKKSDEAKEKHMDLLGKSIEYNDVYRLGTITEKGLEYSQTSCTLDLLKSVSIIADNRQPTAFSPTYDPDLAEPLSDEGDDSAENSLRNARRDDKVQNRSNEKGKSSYEVPDISTCNLIKEYLHDTLPRFNMDAGVEKISVNKGTGFYIISLGPATCPFIGRQHKRSSERKQGAHYVRLNSFESVVHCWKCEGETILLPDPKEELSDLLKSQNPDHRLKRSLYMQTHETVSTFVFDMLKDEIACSPAGASGYLWYYYDKSLHRWVQFEKIVCYIAEENGPVQSAYKNFIKRMSMDKTVTTTNVTTFKELWGKLEKELQNRSFVMGGLLAFLSRKFDLYWSKRKGESLISFQSRLDANPKLMGFTNGVWDLGAKLFRPGRPSDFISKSTEIDYIPYKDIKPDIKTALNDCLNDLFVDVDELNWVLIQLASALDGTPNEQRFFIWTGRGANGKSTLIRLLNLAFGNYSGEVNITLFTKPRPPSNCPTPDLIAMKALRYISCSEPNPKDCINLGTMKWITGGDRITAAAKFQENQSFYIHGTCILLTNDIPPINASQQDNGTWRRIKPVCFSSLFTDEPDPENPYEKLKDGELNEKMKLWKEAFASLLVKIYLDDEKAAIPPAFEEIWNQLRTQSDVYGRFVDECVIRTPDEYRESHAVYSIFVAWLNNMGIKKEISYDNFQKHMISIIGPLVDGEDNDKVVGKGWNIELKPIESNKTFWMSK